MKRHHIVLLAGALLFNQAAHAANSLGEINIVLQGTVVAFTCAAETSDMNKTVPMGTWATKQLRTAGSTTRPISFLLRLTGCPQGSASITFAGTPAAETSLLALSDSEMAKKVAIELRDKDNSRLALGSSSQQVVIDTNGNATLQFYANYIALADDPQPGNATADATFTINYY